MVTGSTEEHHRDHHGDFPARAGLDQLAPPGLTNVTRLRPQYVGQRGAAFECDREPVREPRQRQQTGPVRQRVECANERLARAGLTQHPLQFLGQLSSTRPSTPDRAPRPDLRRPRPTRPATQPRSAVRRAVAARDVVPAWSDRCLGQALRVRRAGRRTAACRPGCRCRGTARRSRRPGRPRSRPSPTATARSGTPRPSARSPPAPTAAGSRPHHQAAAPTASRRLAATARTTAGSRRTASSESTTPRNTSAPPISRRYRPDPVVNRRLPQERQPPNDQQQARPEQPHRAEPPAPYGLIAAPARARAAGLCAASRGRRGGRRRHRCR